MSLKLREKQDHLSYLQRLVGRIDFAFEFLVPFLFQYIDRLQYDIILSSVFSTYYFLLSSLGRS